MTIECLPPCSVQTEVADKTMLKLKTVGEGEETMGQAVAFIYFEGLAVIESLFVRPEHRRQRIGTQLLSEVERWATTQGARRTFIRLELCDLLPSDWLASSRFFLKHDYTFVGVGFTKQLPVTTGTPSA